MKRAAASAILLAAMTAACDDGELVPAEVQEAAKARVAQQAGISSDALFSRTVTGRRDGELVLCGVVEGRRADGSPIVPRRFIAAYDPQRWVTWEAADEALQGAPDFTVQWQQSCIDQNAS